MVECWTNSKLERQEPTQLLIVSLLSILLSSILSAPIFDKHWMNNLRDLTRIVIMSSQRRWKLCSGMTLTVMELWVWERWLWCSDVWDTILLRLNFEKRWKRLFIPFVVRIWLILWTKMELDQLTFLSSWWWWRSRFRIKIRRKKSEKHSKCLITFVWINLMNYG